MKQDQIQADHNSIDNEAKILPGYLIFILALSCGASVANLYYSQTLLNTLAMYLHIDISLATLIIMLTQIGYVAGLLFIVPMADFMNNKTLSVVTMSLLSVSLLCMVFIKSSYLFLLLSFLIGLLAIASPILVPFASHFCEEHQRGRVVGNIMSGLICGIMFSRPLASAITSISSWKVVYLSSGITMAILTVILFLILPDHKPQRKTSYLMLLRSMPGMFKIHTALRRRASYQAMLYGVFSMFWVTIAMHLIHVFHYSQAEIALFAFCSAAGVLTAPVAGRIADKYGIKSGTLIAMATVCIAFFISRISENSITALISAALILDIGVTANLIFGQKAIFGLPAEIRGRLNSLYAGTFFFGGAIGSILSGYVYANWGWNSISDLEILIAMIALCCYLWHEYLPQKKAMRYNESHQ